MSGTLYSIFDRVAEEFGPPQVCKNDAVAVRMARMALKDARMDDYRLYRVGTFDDVKGFVDGGKDHLKEISLAVVAEE